MSALHKHGFSLLELMIAVGLLLTLLTLAMINTNSIHKAVVMNEIELLYNTCIFLQQSAIASNTITQLTFDEGHQAYSFDNHQHTFSKPVQIGILRNVKGPPSSAAHLLKSAITFSNNGINFYPDGIVSSGTIYLLDSSNNHLYAISSAVGHVSMLRKYRYDGKWHLLA